RVVRGAGEGLAVRATAQRARVMLQARRGRRAGLIGLFVVDPRTPEIYTLSPRDALPVSVGDRRADRAVGGRARRLLDRERLGLGGGDRLRVGRRGRRLGAGDPVGRGDVRDADAVQVGLGDGVGGGAGDEGAVCV